MTLHIGSDLRSSMLPLVHGGSHNIESLRKDKEEAVGLHVYSSLSHFYYKGATIESPGGGLEYFLK